MRWADNPAHRPRAGWSKSLRRDPRRWRAWNALLAVIALALLLTGHVVSAAVFVLVWVVALVLERRTGLAD